MMKQVTAWQVGTLVFPTIQEAQKSELEALLKSLGEDTSAACAAMIVEYTDEVVAILTCQPKPKAPRKPRKDIGTKRKPKETGQELRGAA